MRSNDGNINDIPGVITNDIVDNDGIVTNGPSARRPFAPPPTGQPFGAGPVVAGPIGAPGKAPVDPARLRRVRVCRTIIVFATGMAMLLIGGTFLIDQVGPSVQRTAVVTGYHEEVYVRKGGSRSSVDYIVTGRDDRGGTFAIEVSSEEYDHVNTGEPITIERSRLTGRVVDVRAKDWALGRRRQFMTILWALITAGGLVLAVGSARVHLRKDWTTSTPRQQRWTSVTAFGLSGVVLVGLGVWVSGQREGAQIDSSGPAYVLPSEEEASHVTEPGSFIEQIAHECLGAPILELPYVLTKMDGEIDELDVATMIATVQEHDPDCDAAEAKAIVCDQIDRDIANSIEPLHLTPASICP